MTETMTETMSGTTSGTTSVQRVARRKPIGFSAPSVTAAACDAAVSVLRSGWLTTGPRCMQFEGALAAYLGYPYAVTVQSCTQALELALRALRLPPGTPVLTPSLTFCGAVAAILHAGYRPVLVDVCAETLTPTPQTVAAAVHRTGAPGAMICMDMGGYPVDVAALADAAGLPTSRIVRDAAHGPGGDVGRSTGTTSPAATCLSFYATKNLPIGEGGAVLTHDEDLADFIRTQRLHGMSRDAWRRYLPGGRAGYDVVEVGLKANMTDLQAAIGLAQLDALPQWQERRRQLVARYDAAIEACGTDAIRRPVRHPGHAWHLYQVRVPDRDRVMGRLADAGVGTSVHFLPVHHLSAFRALLDPAGAATLPVTDALAGELLSLPLYPSLTDNDVERVVELLADALG